MLTRQNRLTSREDFDRVEKEGKIIQSDSFGVAYFDRRDLEAPRFGFIVSNKISPEATLRNRIKRALRAAVRYSMGEVKKGYDVVFLVKQKSLRVSTEDLMRETKEVLYKAGIAE